MHHRFNRLTESNYNSHNLAVLATLDGKKVWNINDLLLQHVNKEDVNVTYIVASGFINDSLYAVVSVDNIQRDQKFREERVLSSYVDCYLININKGTISPLELQDRFFRDIYTGFRWANHDNKIFFVASTSDTKQFEYDDKEHL